MEEKKCNYSTVKDMLSSLYPRKSEIIEERNKYCEEFFQQEHVLALLGEITKYMDEVHTNSDEPEKDFLYFVLVSRIKELYCRYEEYEKALDVENVSVSKYFDGIIYDSSEITPMSMPIIINEAIAKFKVENELGNQVYEIFKNIYPRFSQLIRIIPPSYRVTDDTGAEFYIGYSEEEMLNILILFAQEVIEKNDTEHFEKTALYILNRVFELYQCLIDEDNAEEIYMEVIKKIALLSKISKNVFDNIDKACEFYKLAFGILLRNSTDIEIHETELSNVIEKFVDFFNGFKSEFYRVNECEVSDILSNLLSLGYTYPEDPIILRKLIQLINKTSTPVYKKDLIEIYTLRVERIQDLFKLEEFRSIVKIYNNQKNSQNIQRFGFEIAYSLNENKQFQEAKNIYESLISSNSAFSGVYNNLGVIYEKTDKDYHKAFSFYSEAIQLNPSDEIAKRNIERVTKRIKELEEKPKKIKELYFKKTKPWHKKILFSIYKMSENENFTFEDLSEVTKQSIDTMRKNLSFLENLEMVEVTKSGIILDPTVEQLIKEYIDPKLERQIIKVDNSKFYRPIFYHESEINLYRALLELFPQHLVFPNISLKTIIDTDKIKDMLDNEHMKYLYMAHVDFVIINTSSYFPVLSFEKDSDFNDSEYNKDLANKKNLIFRTCGIPLIRLRFNSGIEYEKLKHEVREATKHLILEHANNNDTFEIDFEKEFDIKRFGIVNSPVDLELVRRAWEGIVGIAISQKSKIIDIEGEKLIIEMSSEIRPIIEMSFEVIREKVIEKFDIIKEIQINWY